MSEERVYTEAEVVRIALEREEVTLRTLLRSLESVQGQRQSSAVSGGARPTVHALRAQGEVIGLRVAIDAIKRRLR